MIEKKHSRQAGLILWLPIILLLLPSFQFDSVYASPLTIVKIEPDTISAEPGQIFTVNITLLDVLNLYGIEVNLSWDPETLIAINVNTRIAEPDGILYAPTFLVTENLTQEKGKYLLAATSVAPAPSFNGTGTIVTLMFNVSGYANSKFELETELYDYPPPDRWPRISLPIEHVVLDGSFTAIPEFTNLRVMTMFMAMVIMCVVIMQPVRKDASTGTPNQTRLIAVGFSPKHKDREE